VGEDAKRGGDDLKRESQAKPRLQMPFYGAVSILTSKLHNMHLQGHRHEIYYFFIVKLLPNISTKV
jgi:hypothetical protein